MEDQLSKSDTERKQVEEAPVQSEQCFKLRLENSLSSSRRVENLELADIIDIQAIQPLMNDFYKLTHIPIGLNDLKGNVLVGVGWQDICTKFHRVHPETCKHCVESNIKLSEGALPGKFKMYKCKNNMWDIVTPIMVSDQHVGYVFGGQFFFEDEPVDYEFFRAQARKYGFNEEEYIAALEKVPRLSREAVDTGMGFFMTFANMLSQLSYSNIKLAQSLEERNALLGELQENRKDFDRAQEVGNIGSWRLDVCKNKLTWSDENHRIFGIPRGTPLTYETFLSTIHPDDREYVDREWKAGLKGEPYDIEHRIMVDGKIKWVREKAYFESDKDGAVIGGFGITQDITELKKTEEELRLANKYNRSLIEASLDPLVTIGPDGKITDVNNSTEKVTGYPREELIGTDFSDYFTEPEKAKEGYRHVFQEGLVRDYPLRIQHKDGHITSVLYNASIYKDESGEVIGVFAAARDITELKKAEKALKKVHESLEETVKARTSELEEAYKALMDSEKSLAEAQRMAHLGNWDWNIITNELHWSDETSRIFGPSIQTLGSTYDSFLTYVHPEDRDYVDKAIKESLGGKPYEIDYRIISADGVERIIHAHGEVIFDEVNIPVRMKGTVQDITERKKAEEKIRNLANIVESSDDAIITESLDCIITSWNKGAQQVYGYSAEEILGKPIYTLAPPHLEEETKKLVERVKQGERVQQYETLRLRKDGRIINVSITLSPVFDIYGKLTAVSLIYRDITKRREAEEALGKVQEAHIKEIHHRIKNNLQVISSLLDLQAEKFSTLEVCHTSEVVEAFMESQNRVASMALIHEELYKGDELKTLDFAAYLQNLTANLFGSYNLSDDISLKLDLEQIHLGMDTAIPLGIIVNELVSNSLKHAFPAGKAGEININLYKKESLAANYDIPGPSCKEKKGFHYVLTVADNGKGISEEIEFLNADSLGLQLVNILVEQIDGCIELKRNHGTKFTIWFSNVET